MSYLKAFIGFLLVFLIVDIVWINLVVKPMYAEEVGALLRAQPNMLGAVFFYLFYAAAVVFLTKSAIDARAVISALVTGGVIGAISYGTFAVTNYSVLEGWTMKLMVFDMLWGTFITAISAGGGVLANRLFD